MYNQSMKNKAIINPVERIYKNDSYITPGTFRPYLRDYLSLGCRWSFYLDYFYAIFLLWRRARKNRMDYECYARGSYRILSFAEKHRAKLNIEGLDNILESEEPHVIIGNHMSSLEAQTMTGILNTRKIAFVMKESLLTTPFFGPIMRSAYPIPVTRKNPLEDLKSVMEKGTEYLNKGYSVVIFPQGTRTQVFDPNQFNKLGVRLALRAGVSCIPLALKTDYWGSGKILGTFGPIDRKKEVFFSFGPPIVPVGKGREAHEKIVQYIASKLRSWGAQVEEG
jgi:1-acyl-sn-glycerol-3-phosphate acyltransferase